MTFKNIVLPGIALFLMIFLNSCSSIQAGIYLISVEDDEENVLENESNVRIFLENVIISHEDYTIKAYVRTAIRIQYKRTKLLTHSYYVINCNNTGEYYTLSFYGTKIAFYSKGAWAINTNSDKTSYDMYLQDNNKWHVDEIFSEYVINVKNTVENIIRKMDSGTTYYYKDHITDKPNVDNCNTALHETIALESPL